jgi:hypothetical protein
MLWPFFDLISSQPWWAARQKEFEQRFQCREHVSYVHLAALVSQACRVLRLRSRSWNASFLRTAKFSCCTRRAFGSRQARRRLLKRAKAVFMPDLVSVALAEAAGVLTIGRREDSSTFDPIKTAQNIDLWVFANVYDVLIRVDKTGTKLVPGLAESWEVSADGLTYTLKLRNAKFSDGSDLTADDVVFSFTRIRDDKGSLWADPFKVMDTVEATDPKTVTIKLKQATAPFLATLAFPIASVLSKKGFEALGPEKYAEAPIGSAPSPSRNGGAATASFWLRTRISGRPIVSASMASSGSPCGTTTPAS